MSRHHALVGIAVLAAAVMPFTAQADGSAALDPGVYIVGWCDTTEPLPSAMMFRSAIGSLLSQMQQGQAAVHNDFDALRSVLTQANMDKIMADAAQKQVEVVGVQSQSQQACTSESAANSLLQGQETTVGVRNNLNQDVSSYNTGFAAHNQSVGYVNSMPRSAYSPTTIQPVNGTYTPDQLNQARRLSQVATNPSPPPDLPPALQSSAAGQNYSAAVKVHDAQLAAPQAAMDEVLAQHSPTIRADNNGWVQKAWSDMGGTATPPGVVQVNGANMISPDAALSLQVDARYGSDRWNGSLAGEDSVGLLRELVLMEAVRLKIEYQSMTYQELIAQLLAQQQATAVDAADRDKLDQLRAKASSSGGNQ